MAPEEITPKRISIKSLPQKSPGKEIAPAQGILDLGIDRQTEIQGIGMGVLTDGPKPGLPRPRRAIEKQRDFRFFPVSRGRCGPRPRWRPGSRRGFGRWRTWRG